MFSYLQIYDPRERALVGAIDVCLQLVGAVDRLRFQRSSARPRRVLVLRLERIGDLLMSLAPIHAMRELLPDAEIDLAVGSWNADIARLLPGISRIHVVNVPWLTRGRPGARWPALVRQAWGWRQHQYDLAINLEGDARSHLLMWLTNAPRRLGFAHGGGGPLLTDAVDHDPTLHTAANGLRLVARVAHLIGDTRAAERLRDRARAVAVATGTAPRGHAIATEPLAGAWPRLILPAEAHGRAAQLVAAVPPDRPAVGIHVSGGRAIKQWHPRRFGEVAGALARDRGATIVFTGDHADRALVDEARGAVGPDVRVVDLVGALDLVTLAALLSRLSLLVTGDTGPMHLAAAVGTPLVAVFGPSMPWRYAPLGQHARLVRIDLPCSPCNRIRLPPERCRGHVPDCLDGIDARTVLDAATRLLDQIADERNTGADA